MKRKTYETPTLSPILLAPADVITASLFKANGTDGTDVDFFEPEYRY